METSLLQNIPWPLSVLGNYIPQKGKQSWSCGNSTTLARRFLVKVFWQNYLIIFFLWGCFMKFQVCLCCVFKMQLEKSWSTFVCRKWVLDKVAHCLSLFVILTGNKVVMVSCYRLFLISSWGGLVAARVSLWGSGSKWLVTLHTWRALCPCVVLCREPFMTLTHDTDGFPCVFNTHPNDSQASSSAPFPWQWELLNTHIWSFCTGWDWHTGSDQPP